MYLAKTIDGLRVLGFKGYDYATKNDTIYDPTTRITHAVAHGNTFKLVGYDSNGKACFSHSLVRFTKGEFTYEGMIVRHAYFQEYLVMKVCKSVADEILSITNQPMSMKELEKLGYEVIGHDAFKEGEKLEK